MIDVLVGDRGIRRRRNRLLKWRGEGRRRQQHWPRVGLWSETEVEGDLGSCRSQSSFLYLRECQLHQLAEFRSVLRLQQTREAKLVAILLVDQLDLHLGMFLLTKVISEPGGRFADEKERHSVSAKFGKGKKGWRIC